jgi:hypothetical protein
MTPVYSGGLIYEYTKEEAGFGLITLDNGGNPSELPDFSALENAFKNTPAPSGDGGFKANGQASACSPTSQNWKINASLPLIPQGALKYFTEGAGTPLGAHDSKNPNGTQWAGTPTSGFGPASNPGADTSSSGTPKDTGKKNAALGTSIPSSAVVLIFTFAFAWAM